MVDNKQAVVFLMGPTASGKTEIAAKLHDELESELVSVDAAQVYRGMDIGIAEWISVRQNRMLGSLPVTLIT